MNNQFSEKIKILRNRLNMNQFEFSNFLGIKQPSLSTYERNISSPTLDVAVTIAQKCNVSLDWLCGIEYAPRFYSVADVILSLKAINALDGINYELTLEKKDLLKTNYICDIHCESELSLFTTLDEDNKTLGYILEFIYSWKNTEEQLSKLPDEDIKENYRKMWWEKQIAHYSSIPVKTKIQAKEDREYTNEITEKLQAQGLMGQLNLGDIK